MSCAHGTANRLGLTNTQLLALARAAAGGVIRHVPPALAARGALDRAGGPTPAGRALLAQAHAAGWRAPKSYLHG